MRAHNKACIEEGSIEEIPIQMQPRGRGIVQRHSSFVPAAIRPQRFRCDPEESAQFATTPEGLSSVKRSWSVRAGEPTAARTRPMAHTSRTPGLSAAIHSRLTLNTNDRDNELSRTSRRTSMSDHNEVGMTGRQRLTSCFLLDFPTRRFEKPKATSLRHVLCLP